MEPKFAIIGAVVGLLVGLTGVGGGSLMTPLLLLMHIKATAAVGSDLAYSAIMKVFGSIVHKKSGIVNMPLVFRLALGSVPGSLLGAVLVHHYEAKFGKLTQIWLTRGIGVMVILVAVTLLVRSILNIKDKVFTPKLALQRSSSLAIIVPLGFILGFLVGVTSIGAGAFFALAFVTIFGLQMKEIVGTDVVHGMILAAAATLGHLWAGDVNYMLVANLLIGAIPGVLLGSKLCSITPATVLRPTLATVLLMSGLKVLVG